MTAQAWDRTSPRTLSMSAARIPSSLDRLVTGGAEESRKASASCTARSPTRAGCSFLVPQLADSAPQVLDFPRFHAAGREGRAREPALAALEEAEEVARAGHMP